MSGDNDDELPHVHTNPASNAVDHLKLKLGEQYEFLDKWTPRRAGGSVGGFEDLVHVDVEKAKAEKGQMVSFTVLLPVWVSCALAVIPLHSGIVVDFVLALTGLGV